MDVEFNVTIRTDGAISLEQVNEDFDRIRAPLLDLARAVGDGVVVEAECLSTNEVEAMAQRLAELLLQGAAP
jgi:hypothetical protein